jgi:hypothetical protein
MMKSTLTALAAVAISFGLSHAANASLITYSVILNGPNESPANTSPGTGEGSVIYDNVAHTASLHITFQGLEAGTTASHIHCCTTDPGTGTAGVATTTPTFAGFPLGVTSGSYDNVLDLTLASSYNPDFVTAHGGIAGAEAALFEGASEGRAYWNIHTSEFPRGEIRGFLVPEPATIALLGLGLLGLAFIGRKARSSGAAFA